MLLVQPRMANLQEQLALLEVGDQTELDQVSGAFVCASNT